MPHRFDDFAKNILRDALSRACSSETEVEVLAATQKIDVYTVPDPARAAERVHMGLLGELAEEPCLFEPFHHTPTLRNIRRCINKQHTWHHELERRARTAAGSPSADSDDEEAGATEVPFPALVAIGPGQPRTVLDAYGCKQVSSGVYHAVWGLKLRVLVLSELPRTPETLLLRLLGKGQLFRDALADLAKLPEGAWEKTIARPLLVHFQLERDEHATNEEADVNSAEIRAWYEEYERNIRDEAEREGELKGELKGERKGERKGEQGLLLRLLRTRFGELPAATVARVEGAEMADIERWGARMFEARTLADVFDEPS